LTSVPRHQPEGGFTLVEVTIASLIMTIALLAAGLLAAQMTVGSLHSKDMSSAAVLASEKIEDINRWDGDDPQICVPTGNTSVGSLTADVSQTTTCFQGASASVNYFDDVYPNLANGSAACGTTSSGCFAETISSISAGNTVYTTTVHSPNGIVQTTSSASPPTGTTFHRRWVVEANTPVTGVRRVTVLVTLVPSNPPMTFQTSIVRP
jgi:type II secretory pathway pseudopilin PulG